MSACYRKSQYWPKRAGGRRKCIAVAREFASGPGVGGARILFFSVDFEGEPARAIGRAQGAAQVR